MELMIETHQQINLFHSRYHLLYMVCNFDPSIHKKLGKSGKGPHGIQGSLGDPKLEIHARHLSLDYLQEVIQSEGS